MKTYRAESLADISAMFRKNAEAERLAAEGATIQKHKRVYEARATVWNTAAMVLDDTELKGDLK